MERPIDRRRPRCDERRIEFAVRGARQVEERGVAFELGEPQRGGRGIDHGFEKLGDDLLRVHEAHVMEFHEPRVTRDVGDQEQCRLDAHARGRSRSFTRAISVVP